ncbi:MAG TPA: amidohydrolase family protein, partial [Longimicrobiales bacterium]|nr:amidohydrolase family protein [Longimicrobiales bacterium]
MPDLIDVAAGEPFVLEGRVVTMGPRGVITDGAVYVRAGTIEAVEARAAPGPPGFDGARRVKSGGTIYPGLIELHNHLPYNAIPIWLVPRRYENNSQWQGTHEYQRNVSKPAQVLGKTGDLIGPLIRFVECRSLLGGVTTSQGVTLTGTQVSSTKFAGLIRNVERPLVAGLEAVGTRVANPPSKEEEKLAYLETQRGALCYLAHQSEGVNDTARGWFHRLRLQDGTWAIHESFTGIHCTALRAEDFDVLAQNDAKVVWSPLSNYLLYGGTADVGALKASGLPVGLGSDWGPSGSKNLLEELKVARLASDESGNGGFTNEQLVRMVTSDAARILRWDAAVGSIEPGKRADLLVLNGRFGNAFDRLVEARESTITLVMIDGVPRVGQERLMSHTFELEPGVERISYGGAERELYLHQEDAHELVEGVTLDGATAALDDALRHLPERAQALDNAILLSLARHPELARGAAGDRFDRDLMADARLGFEARDGNRYMVELELDPQPLHLLAGGLGDFVFPMALEPITVVSDDDHLAKLVAARNLPDFVREGLPGMYGKPVPAPWEPEGAAVLDRRFPPHVNASVRTFRSFLAERRELGVDERLLLVGQALLLPEENYVHLPFKRSMHGVDPVQRLRLLRHQLQTAKTDADAEFLPADVEFHREITEIFNSLRDLHTTYRLPDPFRGVVAWLPFLVEECWEPDEGV